MSVSSSTSVDASLIAAALAESADALSPFSNLTAHGPLLTLPFSPLGSLLTVARIDTICPAPRGFAVQE